MLGEIFNKTKLTLVNPILEESGFYTSIIPINKNFESRPQQTFPI